MAEKSNILLNEKNIQAPFQYLIGEDDFELLEYTDDFLLTEDNPRLKYREGQKYFIVDLGASIDGDINETNILIDNTKIYPIRVGAIEELRDAIINENNFAVVANDNNFKSVIILPKSNINKRLKYTINTYATSLSNYMFNEIARKLNTLDIDYPIKNFYQNESYKINDIIKYNGYLYRVLKDFNNTENDDRLLISNSMLITPFKRLENKSYKLYDVLEIDNKYFIVQKPFTYSDNKSLENNLSPLVNIIDWYSDIEKLYKNTLLIKDGKKYLVVNEVRMPIWEEVYKNSVIDFIKADEIPADNNENIQEAINRIDKNIEKEIKDRTEVDNNLQQNINNEEYIREQTDNEIKEIKQDKIQNGIDNIIHTKTYNIIDLDLSTDKTNPIIMDKDSIDIAINTNGNIKINLEANNLQYELNENILTIKKIKYETEEEIDYSGTLTITVNKDACLENIYREKSITLYINSNTLYTDLKVDNDVLNIEPNSSIDLALNTNAETIEYYIDSSNYEITKNDKTLNIKNITETEKTGAILIIQATAASTEEITYVPTTIQIYINRTKDEAKELLTLDIISSIEASNNSILKRDEEGASNVNMPSSITNTSIVNNQYLQQELQAGLSTKQDTLTAGTNITIEDNVISASGDLATKAELVTYDNSKTKLEYISGYDFPKFKIEIPETIDFVIAENLAISIKKTNNDYFIEYKALSPFISNNQIILYQENTNLYKLHSTINQFFETVSEREETYYEALDGEILWEEITNREELQNNPPINEDGSINYDLIETRTLQVKSKFKITNGINSYNYLIIKSEALEEIAPNTICLLTLNIKNRVLRNEDTNIFACSSEFMTTQKIIDFYHFTLVQNNDTVILKGEYTQKEGAGLNIGFYSPIIENYFDTPDISSVHELKNTNGITSSSGKPLKFAFAKTNQIELGVPPYLLLLMYQDDTDIQVGDTITFNLTPDKNFTLNPIYQDVTNVQELGEALAELLEDVLQSLAEQGLLNTSQIKALESIQTTRANIKEQYPKQS